MRNNRLNTAKVTDKEFICKIWELFYYSYDLKKKKSKMDIFVHVSWNQWNGCESICIDSHNEPAWKFCEKSVCSIYDSKKKKKKDKRHKLNILYMKQHSDENAYIVINKNDESNICGERGKSDANDLKLECRISSLYNYNKQIRMKI